MCKMLAGMAHFSAPGWKTWKEGNLSITSTYTSSNSSNLQVFFGDCQAILGCMLGW